MPQWYIERDDGGWTPMATKDCEALDRSCSFVRNTPAVTTIKVKLGPSKFDYEVDLAALTQLNLATGRRRRVGRGAAHWYFEGDGGAFRQFSWQDHDTLEAARADGRWKTSPLALGPRRVTYQVDLSAMTQQNTASRRVRRLRREAHDTGPSSRHAVGDRTGVSAKTPSGSTATSSTAGAPAPVAPTGARLSDGRAHASTLACGTATPGIAVGAPALRQGDAAVAGTFSSLAKKRSVIDIEDSEEETLPGQPGLDAGASTSVCPGRASSAASAGAGEAATSFRSCSSSTALPAATRPRIDLPSPRTATQDDVKVGVSAFDSAAASFENSGSSAVPFASSSRAEPSSAKAPTAPSPPPITAPIAASTSTQLGKRPKGLRITTAAVRGDTLLASSSSSSAKAVSAPAQSATSPANTFLSGPTPGVSGAALWRELAATGALMRDAYEPAFAFPAWSLEHLAAGRLEACAQTVTTYYREGDALDVVKKLVKEREPVNIAQSRRYSQGKLLKAFGYYRGAYCKSTREALLPNFAVYCRTPIVSAAGEWAEVHVINVIGYAFDCFEQPDHQYFFPMTALKWQELVARMEQVWRYIFECARRQGLRRVYLANIGGGAFGAGLAQAAFRDPSKSYDKLKEASLSPVLHEYETCVEVRELPRIPDWVFSEDGRAHRETSLLVNAWDPWSMVGNGNALDASLDGFFGRCTAMAVLCWPPTNPHMRYEGVTPRSRTG